MRTWKLSYNGDINKIDKQIKEALESNMDDDKAFVEQEKDGKKVEQNTGVKFPGVSLDMMKKFDIDDIELSTTDIMVIERATEKTRKFIFYFERIEILGYGKCEY
jgi:hypothetical protein